MCYGAIAQSIQLNVGFVFMSQLYSYSYSIIKLTSYASFKVANVGPVAINSYRQLNLHAQTKQNLVCLIHIFARQLYQVDNPWAISPKFVAQSFNRYFEQDNSYIAQIHALQITYVYTKGIATQLLFMYTRSNCCTNPFPISPFT